MKPSYSTKSDSGASFAGAIRARPLVAEFTDDSQAPPGPKRARGCERFGRHSCLAHCKRLLIVPLVWPDRVNPILLPPVRPKLRKRSLGCEWPILVNWYFERLRPFAADFTMPAECRVRYPPPSRVL